MKRTLAILAIPVIGVLLWSMLPLIRGSETLYFRDVFNTHLEKKWVQAEAMKSGLLPLVDPLRDGGRPLLGNPNAVSLYPDNVLYWISPFFWGFNAHFWLHLLIAPFVFYWMCRTWGLSWVASWVGGVCYSTSGFFLSTMNLYNLVGGVTFAPALVASSFSLVGTRFKGRSVGVTALVWSLLLLAGDPMTALVALLLAGSALLVREGASKAPWARWLLSLGLGSIVAAPQLIEFLRILPLSFRGYLGYSPQAATAASWNPITSIEWLLPFAFGKPDLAFWGQRFFGGDPPLFPSLYPGLLALLLIGSSGFSRDRRTLWAWMLIGAGLFLSLGRYNPMVGWLLAIPGLDLFRLPIKFWLLVAVGAGLLCGVGFERLESDSSRRGLAICWSLLLVVYAGCWLVLSFWPQLVPAWLQPGTSAPSRLTELERLRWAGLCFLSVVGLMVYFLIWRFGRHRLLTVAVLVTFIHVVGQMFLLRPMLPMERIDAFSTPAELLAAIPEGAIVTHGKSNGLFGPVEVPLERFPDTSVKWLQKQIFEELYPVAGTLAGRRFDFSISAEGLDSFLTRATAQSLKPLPDTQRVRLLAASGVTRLILGRELESVTEDEARLVYRGESVGGEVFVYEMMGATPEVSFVGEVLRAPHLNAALEWITSEDFDPTSTVVLPEGGQPLHGPPGRVDVLSSSAEAITVEVEAPSAGVLVVQRSFLPIYRARVDQEEVPIVVANMHRLGVELEPGQHTVEIWVDRRPTRFAGLASLLGIASLGILTWRFRG